MFLVSILNFKLGLIFPTLPLIFTCNCTVGHQIWIVWKLHCCWIAVHLWQSSALSEINAMQYILTMWELGADLSSPPWNHPQGLKNLPQKCCGGARGRAGSPRSCQECPTAVSTSWWQYHFFCSFCFVLGFLVVVVVVYLYFSALFLNLLEESFLCYFCCFASLLPGMLSKTSPFLSKFLPTPRFLAKALCSSICRAICKF